MLVLETTKAVVDRAKHVRIDADSIQRWADQLPPDALKAGDDALYAHLPGTQRQLANLTLLIDSLNFCFWSPDPIHIQWRGETYERFKAMLVSLMLAAKYDARWFDAEYWVHVPSEEIRQVLSGKGQLLMMEEREQIIRETGQVLLDRFDGQFIHAIESVNQRAWPLAVLLMTNFQSFRDVSQYGNMPVYFMKRAQICAMDMSITWQQHKYPALSGLEELTAFADYRVPQALRHLGIIHYSPDLAKEVDAGEELEINSTEEVEIRAATVQAVDKMVAAIRHKGRPAEAWQVDCLLWTVSHSPDIAGDHHRLRTIYY